ncbi:DUF397 domain-containing protein [Micromonospora sp. NPDC049102]|uniref:DUF397 domain-containing protein n=1 Tax=Micromonospora sp. NPDC049102 TaxID=3364265 RepID=UPI00371203CE
MKRDFLTTATWRKSSRSLNENAQCVEVALASHAVGIRDSKAPCGPSLVVTVAAWRAFIDGVKHANPRP